MKDHESALQKAVVAALKGDAAVEALLDGRVFDFAALGATDEAAFPYLVIGRCESRPVAADGGGVEQRLTLTGVSRFPDRKRPRRWRRRCGHVCTRRCWRPTACGRRR